MFNRDCKHQNTVCYIKQLLLTVVNTKTQLIFQQQTITVPNRSIETLYSYNKISV